MTKAAVHTLQKRLAARRAIALLTGSHASLGLADRMSNFEGYVPKKPEPRPITGDPVTDRIIRWARGEGR